MGSPPLRVLCLVLVVLIAGVAAVPAHAADDAAARAAASSFLNALAIGDVATFCGLLTPETLARFGGVERCRRAFTEPVRSDYETMGTLQRAYRAAQKSASKRKHQYVTKKFGPAALARDMQRIDKALTVRLGRSPSAAAGQLSTTIVLDTRSTARRLVLYAESDDGSIFRLSAPAQGEVEFDEVAQGVPEVPAPSGPPEPQFQVLLGDVISTANGNALVTATLVATEDGEVENYSVLVEVAATPAGYRVVTFYYSIFDEAAGV